METQNQFLKMQRELAKLTENEREATEYELSEMWIANMEDRMSKSYGYREAA